MDHCEKELTPSDVNQRLVVSKGMLEFLPEIDPENDVPIRVLDETGKVYVFYLSGRRGTNKKPVFQPNNGESLSRREALRLAMSCISGRRKMHFIEHNTDLHSLNRFFPSHETSGFAKAKYNDHHDVMYICLDIWAA
ncbi:hypothetical protein ACE6H2_027253 [Prunus campanulata]